MAQTFGAPLHVHEDDARAASEICKVGETFSERHMLGDDFEVIPIRDQGLVVLAVGVP